MIILLNLISLNNNITQFDDRAVRRPRGATTARHDRAGWTGKNLILDEALERRSIRPKLLENENSMRLLQILLVGQIMEPIVQIVIQAPNLARMFFGDYWSNLPEGPLENPRWRLFFSRWPPFSI